MTKFLNGLELADFIKERQAKAVRGLRQAHGILPKLAIVVTVDNPVIELYMRYKKYYGSDILVDVDVHRVTQDQAPTLIEQLNNDPSIHGIIVQLPLNDPAETDAICNLVAKNKDVDGLGVNAAFDPATPTAILWLLAGYSVDLIDAEILIIGRGKLVGGPLERMLRASDYDVRVADKSTKDLATLTKTAEVIITATGSPGILHRDMVNTGVVIVDAGIASEDGKTVGDVAPDMYEREDITITPVKGGVGPLTICSLFENVITAAKRSLNNEL